MNKICAVILMLAILACKQAVSEKWTAQQVIDKSIQVCGGNLFEQHTVIFDFRDRQYISEMNGKKKTLTRIFKNDTIAIKDVRTTAGLQRFINDTLVRLSDSLANVYANSVNSVHYFSKLPYGLNDPAAQKKLLGMTTIKEASYFKIQVTFSAAGGGDDFDDTYIYWINTATFKPDYLAYSFHVNGGGIRFRVAYNERIINGIRFVDYENLKPKDSTARLVSTDSLFSNGALELLSKIELKNIDVQ